mmetsp:Transcript_20559/g.41149  ORF Transcript_20559/g.41149 Transcript_20559/m.41149 type:complete len:335 (-) Transcript_20559:311-1315(-)
MKTSSCLLSPNSSLAQSSLMILSYSSGLPSRKCRTCSLDSRLPHHFPAVVMPNCLPAWLQYIAVSCRQASPDPPDHELGAIQQKPLDLMTFANGLSLLPRPSDVVTRSPSAARRNRSRTSLVGTGQELRMLRSRGMLKGRGERYVKEVTPMEPRSFEPEPERECSWEWESASEALAGFDPQVPISQQLFFFSSSPPLLSSMMSPTSTFPNSTTLTAALPLRPLTAPTTFLISSPVAKSALLTTTTSAASTCSTSSSLTFKPASHSPPSRVQPSLSPAALHDIQSSPNVQASTTVATLASDRPTLSPAPCPDRTASSKARKTAAGSATPDNSTTK